MNSKVEDIMGHFPPEFLRLHRKWGGYRADPQMTTFPFDKMRVYAKP